MPFGIIDVDTDEPLAGTELLIGRDDAHARSRYDLGAARDLQYVMYKGVETILIPQPSADPNDPLLWPRWKKELAFAVLFLNNIVFAALPGPLIAPSTFALAPILGVTLTQVAELSGYQLLVVGALGPLVSVLAQKFGKRPLFLSASVCGTIGTIVCVAAAYGNNYHALLAGRVVQGLGSTAWESLSLAAVGDIFYLHERGWRTAGTVATLACMPSLVSIIAGVLTQNAGWRAIFLASLPFDIAALLAAVFGLPETQYLRSVPGDVDGDWGSGGGSAATAAAAAAAAGTEKRAATATATAPTTTTAEHKAAHEQVELRRPPPRSPGSPAPRMLTPVTVITPPPSPPRGPSPPRRLSYAQSLRPWSGQVYSAKAVPHLLAEIFAHLLNPAVVWIQAVSGALIALYVASAYITSQIWSVPPYNLNVAQNGFFFVGGFLGGVAATGIGEMCDWTARTMARLNGGVFEAEFRIPVNLVGVVFTALGWFLWMWDVAHPRSNGYLLGAFCHGMVCFGISVPSTSAGLYILDSFPNQATEVFVLQMMVKNFLFYAFSTFINTWCAKEGPAEVFKVFGIVSLALMATSIPMYILGKVNRQFVAGLHSRYKIFRAIS